MAGVELVPLCADSGAGALENLVEEVAEALGRPALGVQPHGRQQLPSRALVLAARLEPGEQPSIDVVAAHTFDVGIPTPRDECPSTSGPGHTPRVPSYYRDPGAPVPSRRRRTVSA